MSELRYKQTDVIELWKKFRNIEINASLDGVEKHGEMIRKDLSWPRFVENVRRIRSEAPHIDFNIHATISVLNLFQIPQMQRVLLTEGLVDYGKLELRSLHEPEYYNIKMLPRRIKREATRLLRQHADWVEDYGIKIGADEPTIRAEVERLENLIKFMWAADLSENVFAFAHYTRSLDRIREETCADLCPELRPLIEHPFQASFLGTVKHLRERAAVRLSGAVTYCRLLFRQC